MFRRARVQFWALPRVRPAARWRANSREPQAERYPYAGVLNEANGDRPEFWQNEPNRAARYLGRTNPTGAARHLGQNEPNRAARHLGRTNPTGAARHLGRTNPTGASRCLGRTNPTGTSRCLGRTNPTRAARCLGRTNPTEPHGVSAERTHGTARCLGRTNPTGTARRQRWLQQSRITLAVDLRRAQGQQNHAEPTADGDRPAFRCRGRDGGTAPRAGASSSPMRVCRSLSTGHQHKHVS